MLNQNKAVDPINAKVSSPKNEFHLTRRSIDDNFCLKKHSFLSRSLSRRSKTPNPALERNASRTKMPLPDFERNASRNFCSPLRGGLDRNATSSSRKGSGFENVTTWNISSPTLLSPKTPRVFPTDHASPSTSSSPGSVPAGMTRKGSNPIIYSQSTVRRKPPPIERKLECTLEELCHGSVKKIKITRDVINEIGFVPLLIFFSNISGFTSSKTDSQFFFVRAELLISDAFGRRTHF